MESSSVGGRDAYLIFYLEGRDERGVRGKNTFDRSDVAMLCNFCVRLVADDGQGQWPRLMNAVERFLRTALLSSSSASHTVSSRLQASSSRRHLSSSRRRCASSRRCCRSSSCRRSAVRSTRSVVCFSRISAMSSRGFGPCKESPAVLFKESREKSARCGRTAGSDVFLKAGGGWGQLGKDREMAADWPQEEEPKPPS